tara:strand:+ start:1092 stop:2519 length:1428 start_codon:yes stop_codon:yes gene_type:complete
MPITFVLNIEEPRGRSVTRNLTRGVNAISDIPLPPPPPQGDQEIFLQTLLLSLSVSSEFNLRDLGVPLSSVVVDLTLPELTLVGRDNVKIGDNIDPVEIGLTSEEFEVEVGGDLDVPGIELSVPTIGVDASRLINLSPVTIDLSLDSQDVRFGPSEEKDFAPAEMALGVGSIAFEVGGNVISIPIGAQLEEFQLESKVTFDAAEVDLDAEFIIVKAGGDIEAPGIELTLEEFEVELGGNIEAPGIELTVPEVSVVDTDLDPGGDVSKALDQIDVNLSLEEFEVELGGNIEAPGIELTVDEIEIEADGGVSRALDAVIVDLSLSIEIEADGDVSKALDQIDVNLASNIGIEVVDNTPGMIVALTVPQIEVKTGSLKALDTLNVDLVAEEFEVELGGNIEAPGINLTVPAVEVIDTNDLNPATITVDLLLDEAFNNSLNLQTLEADFILTESLDVGLSIQLPANMESAQADDATTIT